jgi:hypothetical protein
MEKPEEASWTEAAWEEKVNYGAVAEIGGTSRGPGPPNIQKFCIYPLVFLLKAP